MWDWLTDLAFYAHGYCLSWDPWLIGLHAGSDLAIFSAYTAIPVAILIYLHKRPKLELKALGRFFAAFIFWCGLTHLVAMITLWIPIYDLQAVIKIITAAISIATAVIIFRLMPAALAIPSPAELQSANDRLKLAVAAHESTLHELRVARDELEQRVQDRTRSLEEAALHAETLVKEIAHRSGNLMSVITAMARQTATAGIDAPEYASRLAGRIEGMGRAHDVLFKQSWKAIDLRELIKSQLDPFCGMRPCTLEGPPLAVSPAAAHALGMAFYELATNALKYGSLSVDEGSIDVRWSLVASHGTQQLELVWREQGGPAVSQPTRQGWGSKVTGKLTSFALQGEASASFEPAGLVWTLKAPVHDGLLSIGGR